MNLVQHTSEWGSFTLPADDEVLSVEPAPAWHGSAALDTDAVLAALSARLPYLSAGMWPGEAATLSDIGSDYSQALFPRDLFISLRSLAARYPVDRFLPVVDEVFRRQNRDGKLFHEHRDPNTLLARNISALTGCTWPWFAADDVTGDGACFVMELALKDRSILQRRVGDATYADIVKRCIGWELRRMEEGGRHLILSRPLPRPEGSTWMPPIGSVWKDRSILQRRVGDATYAGIVKRCIGWELRRVEEGGRHLILSRPLPRPEGSTWMPPIGSVWKDSPDGFVRLDGTLPTRPVALVEVQCILYRSLVLAAQLGLADQGLAEKVRYEFLSTFWVDDDAGGFPGYFAELDESGRHLVVAPIAASSLIDTIASGLLDGPEHADRLRAVMRHLYDPELGLRGALGVRSLSTSAPHYYPSGGDKGAVWPYLNDRLASAVAERGFHRCAHHDDQLVLRICEDTRAVPEFVPDAAEPEFDRVRVKVRRARPEPYITTAIEPAKPWQLWTLGALARSSARAAAFARESPPSTSDLDEQFASLAREAAVV